MLTVSFVGPDPFQTSPARDCCDAQCAISYSGVVGCNSRGERSTCGRRRASTLGFTPVTAFMGKCRLGGRSNQSPGDALFRQPTDGSITSDQHARRVHGMGALHLSGHAAATPPTSET